MSDSSDHEALHRFLTSRGYTAVQLVCNAAGHFELADANLNGNPVRLLLDTGASHTVVDRGSAARLGLATAASTRRGGGVGGADQVLTTATLASLVFGSTVFANHTAYVMDLRHVSDALTQHGGMPIDGAVGGDLLRPAEAVIDYSRNMLYVKAPAPSRDDNAMRGSP